MEPDVNSLEGRELIFWRLYQTDFHCDFSSRRKVCCVFQYAFSEPGFLAASYGVSTLCNVSCKFCSGQGEASKCFK